MNLLLQKQIFQESSAPNLWESSTKQTVFVGCDSIPTICNCSTKSKLDKLQNDFVTIKSYNETLEKLQSGAAKKTTNDV